MKKKEQADKQPFHSSCIPKILPGPRHKINVHTEMQT